MLFLDRQGWITVVAGLLLALITLFTSYDHVDLPALGTISIDQQIGVPLLLASLAALAFGSVPAAWLISRWSPADDNGCPHRYKQVQPIR